MDEVELDVNITLRELIDFLINWLEFRNTDEEDNINSEGVLTDVLTLFNYMTEKVLVGYMWKSKDGVLEEVIGMDELMEGLLE